MTDPLLSVLTAQTQHQIKPDVEDKEHVATRPSTPTPEDYTSSVILCNLKVLNFNINNNNM